MSEKRGRGQPQYEPTQADRNTVKSMMATGFTQPQIARCIGTDGIDEKTLRLHFRDELDTSRDKANAAIANVAYQRAIAGEAWAVCFWLKCRAGWKETQVIEHEMGGSIADVLRQRRAARANAAQLDSPLEIGPTT